MHIYDKTTKSCKKLELEKTTITINFVDTTGSIGTHLDADPNDYYYRTVKFYTTPSSNVIMKTYPGKTCTTKYKVDSTVVVKEGVETTYESSCGYANSQLLSSSTAKIETYVGSTLVDSVDLYAEGSGKFHSALKNRTHENGNYIIKYVEGFTCKQKGYKTKADCSASETFSPVSGSKDVDGTTQCGTCKYNYFDIYLDSSPAEIYCYKSANNSTRKYTRVNIYLTDEKGNKAKDIYGNTVAKITSSGARFTKGNYILNLAWEADDYSVIPYIEMMSLMPVSAAVTTDKCWGNGQEALDSGCEKPLSVSGNSTAFRSSSYTFEAGDHYRVGYSYSSPKGVTCKKYK